MLRETRTTTLAFVRVNSEPSVASLAHARAMLGTGGAGHWHAVVACAYVGWDTHAHTYRERQACARACLELRLGIL